MAGAADCNDAFRLFLSSLLLLMSKWSGTARIERFELEGGVSV